MELPDEDNADLHTETRNGGLDIDFPITVRGRLSDVRRRIDATLGSSGAWRSWRRDSMGPKCPKSLNECEGSGVGDGSRTRDIRIHNPALYP
jgi:hypothetical protein